MHNWIKVDVSLKSSPGISILKNRLKTSRPEAAGIVLFLWSYCFEHCPDGIVSDIMKMDLNEICNFNATSEELLSALQEAKFIIDNKISHIENINSLHIQRAKWVKSKDKKDTEEVSQGIPQEILENSTGIPLETPCKIRLDKRREEEIRKENKTKDTPSALVCVPSKDTYPQEWEKFYQAYKGSKSKKSDFAKFKKHSDWKEALPKLSPGLEMEILAKEYARKKGEFVPNWKNLSTWINNRCWEAEHPILAEAIKKQKEYASLPANHGLFALAPWKRDASIHTIVSNCQEIKKQLPEPEQEPEHESVVDDFFAMKERIWEMERKTRLRNEEEA